MEISGNTTNSDFFNCSQTYSYDTSTERSCPSTPESQIRLISASPSLAPPAIRGSNFFYNSFNETRTDDISPEFASDNVSCSCISPELLQLQRSRFRGMHASKRTAPANEQQQHNKRPRRTLEKAKRNLFKPCFVSRAFYTPPGFQQNSLTPETQHTGADSRPCSPQSQEIQRIMGRWPVTRPEACCFVPLSPCLPFRPRGGSLRNNSA